MTHCKIICFKCGIETKAYLTRRGLFNAWNRRADANSLTEALKRNTTEIVEKASGIYAEYIRHLQERNKALDEELASLLNKADAGIKGRGCRMGINEFHNPGMIPSPGDGADMREDREE